MMIPLNFEKQIFPGTFEYTLCHLIDNQNDMSVFEYHFENDQTGSPAYDPAIILKIILYAYSKCINSSKKIEKLCHENIVCMTLAAHSRPHFTTTADCISSRHEECCSLFSIIISLCYTLGSMKQSIKSNVVDNESAKMSTGRGVFKGYNPIAAVDDKNQLIIFADAYGDIMSLDTFQRSQKVLMHVFQIHKEL